MTPALETPGGDADLEATRQADAMKAKLRKDVESWSKARSAEPSEPIGQQPAPRPVKRVRKAAPAKPSQPDPGSTPYRMSYDGGTSAEYIQYMINRGAR